MTIEPDARITWGNMLALDDRGFDLIGLKEDVIIDPHRGTKVLGVLCSMECKSERGRFPAVVDGTGDVSRAALGARPSGS